jgi:K+-transporting ATPase ATPase C chain
VLGVAYPLVVTGIAQVAFPGKADGSRLERDGELVGSALIGQDFEDRPQYFQSRPSPTGYAADGRRSPTPGRTRASCATRSASARGRTYAGNGPATPASGSRRSRPMRS